MGLNSKKVLVTGGAGFIGSHLADKLIELGSQVTIVDNLSFGNVENVNKQANLVRLDICDYSKLKDVLSETKPQLIFHLAANATTKETAMGWNDPLADYRVNAVGTLNILKAVTELGIDSHIIYASSAAVYGESEYFPIDENHPTNPVSPYGVSKLAGEKYVLAYHKECGIKGTILRIFNTYGPRQPRYVIFDLIQKLKENPNKLEVLGTGQQIRDYCYIADTVNALILAINKKGNNVEIFNVASGIPTTINQLVNLIVRILGLEGSTKVYYTGESWKGDLSRLSADISRIKDKLEFKPKVSLEEGLQRFINWLWDKDKGVN